MLVTYSFLFRSRGAVSSWLAMGVVSNGDMFFELKWKHACVAAIFFEILNLPPEEINTIQILQLGQWNALFFLFPLQMDYNCNHITIVTSYNFMESFS